MIFMGLILRFVCWKIRQAPTHKFEKVLYFCNSHVKNEINTKGGNSWRTSTNWVPCTVECFLFKVTRYLYYTARSVNVV